MARGGYLDAPGGAGTQTVSGLGFTPGIVLFMAVNGTAEGWSATAGEEAWLSLGFGTWADLARTGTFSGCRVLRYQPTADYQGGGGSFDTACVLLRDAGGGTDLVKASLVSLDDDGFTFGYAASTSGYRIYWLALGDPIEIYGISGVGTANQTYSGMSGVASGGMQFDSAANALNIDYATDTIYPNSVLGTFAAWAYAESYPGIPTVRGWRHEQASRPFLGTNAHETGVGGDFNIDHYIARIFSPYFAGYYTTGGIWFDPTADGGIISRESGHAAVSWGARAEDTFWGDDAHNTGGAGTDQEIQMVPNSGAGGVPIEPEAAVTTGASSDDVSNTIAASFGFWADENDFHAVVAIGKFFGSGACSRYMGRDYSWMSDFSAVSPGANVTAGRMVKNPDPSYYTVRKTVDGAGRDDFGAFLIGPIGEEELMPQIYRLVKPA